MKGEVCMRQFTKKLRLALLLLSAAFLCMPAVKVKAAPAAPAVPALTAVAKKNTVTLNWKQVKNASGYQIYLYYPGEKKFKCISTTKPGITSMTLVGSTDRTYRYKIRAFTKKGGQTSYSALSPELSMKTAPSAPELASVRKKNEKSAIIRWKKISSSEGYQVARAEKAGGPYKRVAVIHDNKTVTYTDSTLAKDKTYYYKVRAYVRNPGAVTYSTYSKAMEMNSKRELIVIGDSRTEDLRNAVGEKEAVWICKQSMGYTWLRDTASKEADKYIVGNEDVVIWLGVNDPSNNLGKNKNYQTLINSLAKRWKERGAEVYFMEVGPIIFDEYVTVEQIEKFNANMKAGLKGVKYIPLYSWLKSQGFGTPDGLHYDNYTSKNIYNYMKSKIS